LIYFWRLFCDEFLDMIMRFFYSSLYDISSLWILLLFLLDDRLSYYDFVFYLGCWLHMKNPNAIVVSIIATTEIRGILFYLRLFIIFDKKFSCFVIYRQVRPLYHNARGSFLRYILFYSFFFLTYVEYVYIRAYVQNRANISTYKEQERRKKRWERERSREADDAWKAFSTIY